jgi:hypothetical protein
MNDASRDNDRKWEQLLAGRVLSDLTEEEQAELSQRGGDEDAAEVALLEGVVTAIYLAHCETQQPILPEGLRRKILEESSRYIGDASNMAPDVVTGTARQRLTERSRTADVRRMGLRESLAWMCVAASLLWAVTLWNSNRVAREPSMAQQRSSLLQDAKDTIQVAWAPGKTPFPKSVSGDVVWSNSRQAGFMSFSGMPVNDPSVEQYQLWIIDPDRDQEPIDGGVFDISSAEKVIVPIHAKLAVLSPKAFAITIEQPGGVVVSTQERLPLLAAVN